MITDSYLLPPRDGDYLSLRHLVVRGTNEEIGRDLATLAKADYGVVLSRYADPVFGQARLAYFRKNWPAGHARALGVAAAYGVDPEAGVFDPSSLAFDLGGAGCSAVFIPPELSADGHPLVGRNYDWFVVTAREFRGEPKRPGDYPYNARSQVTELRPDGGHGSLHIGGMDLLTPWIDGINDAGLVVTTLSDPTAPAAPVPMAGGRDTGLSQYQLPVMLLEQCATVAEAKLAVLQQSVFAPASGLHVLIADAGGAATVFEIDGTTRQAFFVDARPDAPLIVTNHPLHRFPDRSAFPPLDMRREHDSFVRLCLLQEAVAKHQGKYTRSDLQDLLDVVACAFVDGKAAGVFTTHPERTMWTHTADLAERTFKASFYLGDIGPGGGPNRLKVRRSEPILIGFSR